LQFFDFAQGLLWLLPPAGLNDVLNTVGAGCNGEVKAPVFVDAGLPEAG
jgi:hypothetical protein